MDDELRFLLLVSCSARKRLDDDNLPALARYDGVVFRLLRKAEREGRLATSIDLLVLSAKFGLLERNIAIPWYDLRMTTERAVVLRPQVANAFGSYIQRRTYAEMYIEVGKLYLAALPDIASFKSIQYVKYGCGRIGERLSKLHAWLADVNRRVQVH